MREKLETCGKEGARGHTGAWVADALVQLFHSRSSSGLCKGKGLRGVLWKQFSFVSSSSTPLLSGIPKAPGPKEVMFALSPNAAIPGHLDP